MSKLQVASQPCWFFVIKSTVCSYLPFISQGSLTSRYYTESSRILRMGLAFDEATNLHIKIQFECRGVIELAPLLKQILTMAVS